MASLQALQALAPAEKVNVEALVSETAEAFVLTIPKRVALEAFRETTTDKHIPFVCVVPKGVNAGTPTVTVQVYERVTEAVTGADGQTALVERENVAPVKLRLGTFNVYAARK